MTIDTHQHFWRLARGDYRWLTSDIEPLYRDFLPEDLAPLLQENNIQGTIAVQAADSEAETEYLLSLADQHDWILGVVGWVDLDSPHAVASIERLSRHPKLVGLRPMIQDMDDDQWMLRTSLGPAISAMVEQYLTFDALVLPRHLGYLKTFLSCYPQLTVVVDHCAKPDIRNDAFEPWAAQMAQIAQFQNVFCKLSGLVTEAAEDWTEADLRRYVVHILQSFAPDRVMFGSDWPVVNLASDYGRWVAVFNSTLKAQTPQDQYALETGSALRAYPRLRSKP